MEQKDNSLAETKGEKNEQCRLCGGVTEHAFTRRLMGRHDADFFLCRKCGLLQSERPYWLKEAYSKAISSLDTGAVHRNLTLLRVVAPLLLFLGKREGTFLDFGGGHGLFTRLMRDHGFDFRWQDRYAENLFAAGFEYEGKTDVSVLTAFEVFEHLEHPAAGVEEIFGRLRPDIVIASTELFSEPIDPGWEYIYPENGQHVTFFQERTLDFIAEKYGYNRVSWRFLHLFSREPLPLFSRYLFVLSWMIFPLLSPILRRRSLHLADHRRLVEEKRRHEGS